MQRIEYCSLKVINGARFIIAQYCYNNTLFFDFVERLRAMGVTSPVIPGIMPIYSVKLMEGMAKVCRATIPRSLRDDLAGLPQGDPTAVANYGIDFAVNQCRELLEHGVDGLHFYTMNRSNSITGIIDRLRNDGMLKR